MKKLKIGCLDYTVEEVGPSAARAGGMYGAHVGQDQKILIEADLLPDRYKEVLIHEILHAVYSQWIAQPPSNEEQVVTGMAFGLASVFKDNPKLKTILFGD